MKALVKFIPLFVVATTISAYANASVNSFPNRHKNQFVLRTDRDMLGAKVDVLTAGGGYVTSQRLKKTKMIIDFAELPAGQYTIMVIKDDYTESFTYIKKN